MKKIIIMVDKSAGNSSVGNMWTETHLFDESATLKDVLKAINGYGELYQGDERVHNLTEAVRLQIAQEVNND